MLKHKRAVSGQPFGLDEFRERSDESHKDHPKPQTLRGLGDVVDRVTTATGIKAGWQYLNGGECGGCEERRRRMNEMFPFKG